MRQAPATSRDEVISAYRLILGREPESEAVIDYYRRFARPSLVELFLQSDEGRSGCPLDPPLTRLPSAVASYQVFRGYTEADLGIFDSFPIHAASPESGFIRDFLGNRTRTDVSAAFASMDGQVFGYPVPGDYFADAAEWLGLLKAVLGADGRFRMAELGAGWGPWIVAGHTAARHRGIGDIRVYALEGNAGHLPFLRQHCRDNGIDPDEHVLLNSAIGSASGTARWPVVDTARSAEHYGLRPVGENDTDYHGRVFEAYVDVPVVGIADLLSREETWNLLHVDVQGSETGICHAAIEHLDRQVAWLIIGTHSRKIDGDLMALFHAHGWVLEHERPAVMHWNPAAPTLESMTTTDGTQVWRNPRLAAPIVA